MLLKIYIFLWILFIFYLMKIVQCNVEDVEPGQCISRFDYDHKMMQKMIQLEALVSEQTREIQELKVRHAYTEVNHVAFMAQLSQNIVNPQGGTTVVFDEVLTNVGKGYKPGPGSFLAPVSGTYSINLVASSYTKAKSERLHLHIMHNTSRVGYIFLDSNTDRSLIRSTTAVLELSAGDTVFVKVANNGPKGTVVGCCFHGF